MKFTSFFIALVIVLSSVTAVLAGHPDRDHPGKCDSVKEGCPTTTK